MNPLEDYFDHLEEFPFKQVFKGIQFAWEPLDTLDFQIDTLFDTASKRAEAAQSMPGLTLAETPTRDGDKTEKSLLGTGWVKLESAVFFEEQEIFIGAGTIIEPTAIIKGPAVIGSHCEIRQGAYIRGNAVVGDHCTVGHATEIKNSILMNHTEAGHFNYIGDSILGSYVNLGAGTKLANVEFRGIDEKVKVEFNPIVVDTGKGDLDTGRGKLGAILGDYVEMGCNSVSCPGVFIGKDSWIFPNTTVPKGVYPPKSLIGPQDRKLKIQIR